MNKTQTAREMFNFIFQGYKELDIKLEEVEEQIITVMDLYANDKINWYLKEHGIEKE